ncbi:MAG: FkbM family methyltransferase [bacterium]
MDYRRKIRQLLLFLRRTLWRGPVRKVVEQLNLRPALETAYWSFLRITSPPTTTLQLEGASAEYGTESLIEVLRFNEDVTLGGEKPVLTDLLKTIRPDDVFYDIGACTGMYSCLVGDKLSNGSIVAVEPHPDNFRRLNENLSRNDIPSRSFQLALSNRSESATLHLDEREEPGAGGHTLEGDDSSSRSLTVHTLPGDQLITDESLSRPTILKIDVEGAEKEVLQGFSETLRTDNCRLVYCEVHKPQLEKKGLSTDAIRGILQEAGFKTSIIHERQDQSFLKGSRS